MRHGHRLAGRARAAHQPARPRLPRARRRAGSFVTIALPNSIEFFEAVRRDLEARRDAAADARGCRPPSARDHRARGAGAGRRRRAEAPGRPVPAGSSRSRAVVRPLPPLIARVEGADVGRQHRPAEADRRHPARRRVDPGPQAARGCPQDGVQLVTGPLYHNAPFVFSMLALCSGDTRGMPRFDATRRSSSSSATASTGVRGADDDAPHLAAARARAHALRPLVAPRVFHWRRRARPGSSRRGSTGSAPSASRALRRHRVAGVTSSPATSGSRTAARSAAVTGRDRVLDGSGNELPPGEIGEIFMRRGADGPPTLPYIGAEAEGARGLGVARRHGLPRRRRLPVPRRPPDRHDPRRRRERVSGRGRGRARRASGVRRRA